MSVICDAVVPLVANAAVEGRPVSRVARAHVDQCLQCQARHAAMTRAARLLATMGNTRYEAPRDLEWRVMSSLEGDLAVERTWRRPVTFIAAGISMAVAIVFWRVRPKTS